MTDPTIETAEQLFQATWNAAAATMRNAIAERLLSLANLAESPEHASLLASYARMVMSVPTPPAPSAEGR